MVLRPSFPPRLKGFYRAGPRYFVLYGGRGSAKSWSAAEYVLLSGLERRHRILCAREIQKSIKASVKKLLDDKINAMGLRPYYRSTDTSIVGVNGTEFMFAGLRHNPETIKSMEGVTILWIEEAQTISRDSFEVIKPTIRQPGSIILLTLNPRFPDDPVYEDFLSGQSLSRDDARVRQINWQHNPWFPDVLRAEMEHMRRTNFALYEHIWEGKILVDGDALVFGSNVVCEWCEPPDDVEFMFGCDFGYAQDPLTLNRTWMSEDESTIFIDYEAHAIRTEIDDIPDLFDEVPGAREWPIIADSANPALINYLRHKGFQITGAEKGKGSIEDGIIFLQGKKIVIHPRCKHTLGEFKTHKFKRHAQTNAILPKTEDANNHHIDGMRYAYEGKWMKSGFHVDVF